MQSFRYQMSIPDKKIVFSKELGPGEAREFLFGSDRFRDRVVGWGLLVLAGIALFQFVK